MYVNTGEYIVKYCIIYRKAYGKRVEMEVKSHPTSFVPKKEKKVEEVTEMEFHKSMHV